MTFRTPFLALLSLVSLFMVSSCVTNQEESNPDGWVEILPPPDLRLQKQVPKEILDRGYITIGTNPPFAPAEFKDSSGNIIGLDMDLIKAASSQLGLEVKIQQQDFPLILPSLTSGTIDVGVSGFSDTPDRREKYEFVDYLQGGLQWSVGRESKFNPGEPCGFSIAVQKGTYADLSVIPAMQENCLASSTQEIHKLVYDSADAAANATILHRTDAFLGDALIVQYAVARSSNRLTTVGDTLPGAPFGWVLPKNSPLTPVLAQSLQKLIDTGEYADILEPWGASSSAISAVTINQTSMEDNS